MTSAGRRTAAWLTLALSLSALAAACSSGSPTNVPTLSPSGLPASPGSSAAPIASADPTAGATAGTPAPAPSLAPSPLAKPSPVRSAAEAAARVIVSDPRFAGVGPLSPDLIGASAWYEVAQTADGFHVGITMGWGDCMAGCISRHIWEYDVSTDGTITGPAESGDPWLGGPPPAPGGEGKLEVTLTAGPTCPVERPGDPDCAPRPVVNAAVSIRDPFGVEVARLTTDGQGMVGATLPSGTYVVEALAVPGFMGTAEPVAVSITAAGTAAVTLMFDTGIR
jgi:hypothetical protein